MIHVPNIPHIMHMVSCRCVLLVFYYQFLLVWYNSSTHVIQGCFTWISIWLPQSQWCNPGDYGWNWLFLSNNKMWQSVNHDFSYALYIEIEIKGIIISPAYPLCVIKCSYITVNLHHCLITGSTSEHHHYCLIPVPICYPTGKTTWTTLTFTF